jgi:hypothetical protein
VACHEQQDAPYRPSWSAAWYSKGPFPLIGKYG